jgi:hypothetical protein
MSRAVATYGNRSQIGPAQDRLKQAEPIATGCDRLQTTFDDK